MKRLIHTLLFLISCLSLKSQVYSNEWINFSNKYFKFPVYRTGFYRIDSTALANSGIPVNSINPKNFQLFIKGKEEAIYIKGENDNVFNYNDYIEFFAHKNDGTFDSALYNNINYLPNPFVSIFTDTIYGFLTWNNSTSNKRLLPETDTASVTYTPANYFYSEKIHTQKVHYNSVQEFPEGAADPRYTQAEGYGHTFSKTQIYNSGFGSLNLYNSEPLNAYLKLTFSGMSFNTSFSKDHQIKGSILDKNNNPIDLFDTLFSGYKPFRYDYTLNANNLGNASNVSLNSLNNAIFSSINNTTLLHYIYLKYPHTPDLEGTNFFKLFVPDDINFSKTYLKVNNFYPGSNNVALCYDLTNNKRIETKTEAGFTKILIPNSGAEKVCYLSAESNTIAITNLYPVNQTGYFNYYKTPATDSAFVIVTHKSLQTSANAYKNYRQSAAGGSHKVVLADIDDLYDQFAFGIKKHPLAIKNFCRYLIDSLASPPKNLFIIGKAVQQTELNSGWSKCLVPTMGVPPSDNLLTCNIKTGNSVVPEIAIGRLAAQSNSEVQLYLDKVMQHETTGLVEWKKNVLHFAGGTDFSQQTLFQSYLNNYKHTIEDTLFGGKVYTFKKTTTAPIQITISDSIKKMFNRGVGLVTFFGHGSYAGFDQAIDDPAAYNNAGKYPFFIANSCYSGNIHTFNVKTNSEKFVLINQKGAIGFLASASLGFVYNLNIFSSYMYQAIGKTKYNKSIGECVKEACFKSSQISYDLQNITILDMTLHSDPAIIISNGSLPDYMINNSKISFDTKKHVDSIGVNIIITNLGKAIRDSIIVKTERFFPNGDSLTVLKKIKTPLFKDTLKFFMLLDYTRGIGLNRFKVFVDAYSAIAEANENNNQTTGTVDLFIQGGDIVPVYPYKYAVVPKTNTITLKASTSDPFAKQRHYKLQLDTCDAFTNPIQQTTIQSIGGVVEWTVNLPFADSTVYYWRVSRDSTGPSEGYLWRESSFQTVNTKHGWGQAHFFQFKNNGYQFVKYKKQLRKFEFENDITSLECRTGFLPHITFDNITYSLNGSVIHVWNCGWNGWSFAVFDSISGKPWATVSTNYPDAGPGPYNNCHCDGGRPLYAFDFGVNNYCGFSTWQTDMLNFINAIPPNNYVLAYSAQNHGAQSYNSAMYTAFESFGSGNIQTVKDTTSIIIFGKKGMLPGQAHEEIAAHQKSIITLNDSIKTKWNNGYIASEIIGPSFKWNSLHWRVKSLETLPGDTSVLKLVGIKNNGQRDTLATFISDSTDVLALYNYVSASTYPYLQLVALMKDNIHRTSPQLKRWQVLYDEAPECAINPKKGFNAINDSLQEGDYVTFHFPVENIGIKPFNDSLVFTYWIEDANHVNHLLPQKLKATPFNPGAIIIDTIKINSHQFAGANALWIDVNPPLHKKYQYEQYHFNNIARYPFNVTRDIANPLLDVTFDGIRIMNGDIVSAKPVIVISLKDENKFLALNDTAAFSVFLKKPNEQAEQRLFFANELQFSPAQLPNNSCKIEYYPHYVTDGKYTLIVQAKDRSDNVSGAADYRITFEVVNKPSITGIINYPNPFSTSTRFVFTLTGSEIPEVFNIQIMTISGKVVKTIMKDDLGPIRIGRNITQYAWDGKDDFGDKLANGVYLYKVQTKLNGQNIEKQATAVDQYFTKEIGKMVIMR